MLFNILFLIALFTPLLVIAAGVLVHGQDRERRRNTQVPP